MTATRTAASSRLRHAAPALAVLILVAMGATLAKHGGTMLAAASGLGLGALALSLGLSLVYRAVNAAGWGLVLRSLGEPAGLVASARIWLAAEACRWLPGSLWSYGSRAVLASRRGLAGPTVAASLVLELAITVAAWVALAMIGGPELRLPPEVQRSLPEVSVPAILAVAALVGLGVAAVARSGWGRRRLAKPLAMLRQLRGCRPSLCGLAGSFAFYLLMGAFQGAALAPIVRSLPGGAACPFGSIVAANAIAWLVGFFALFAPGGLVVREACLAALLSPWLAPEHALAAALAWRLVQIVAEIACFLAVAAVKLPPSLATPARTPGGTVPAR